MSIAKAIESCKDRQNQLEAQLKDEKQLETALKDQLNIVRAMEFLKKYDCSAEDIRTKYTSLVRDCSKSCTKGHYIKLFETPDMRIAGRNLIDHGGDHTYLQHEHYEKCIPDDMTRDAFKVIGRYIWVEPTPHREYWGN